ncbi:hypothetical protein SDC9_61114 [bioreactor metagenome]|uniref:Glycosyl transferase family 2 n=2 Tax=root TaxID=1 RepID=A0A4R8LWA3_9BACT|nr:glycosyltransferase family 2 protein [Aminivibrio pyruvatiphilus]TDY52098.1 glycosyl transferase family 2 [Aminivibrio pyruvatiphilus]
MNLKISVIIPAYNAEKTLRRCLDSVFASDFHESMEVILVNDGSKDGTLQVAEEYNKYPNFVLIDQPNGGVALARWTGISASRGEYLGFVDADDYIAPDMISKMYGRAMETGAEIVICGVYKVRGGEAYPLLTYEGLGVEESQEAIVRTIIRNRNGSLCNKVILRDLIQYEDCNATKNLEYGEDLLLLFFALRKAKKVAFVVQNLYYYVDNPNSVTRNPSLKALQDCLFVYTYIYNAFAESANNQWKRSSLDFYFMGLTNALRHINRIASSDEIEEVKKEAIDKICQVSLMRIIKNKNKRILLDYILVKSRAFGILYSIWEGKFFQNLRKL